VPAEPGVGHAGGSRTLRDDIEADDVAARRTARGEQDMPSGENDADGHSVTSLEQHGARRAGGELAGDRQRRLGLAWKVGA